MSLPLPLAAGGGTETWRGLKIYTFVFFREMISYFLLSLKLHVEAGVILLLLVENVISAYFALASEIKGKTADCGRPLESLSCGFGKVT